MHDIGTRHHYAVCTCVVKHTTVVLATGDCSIRVVQSRVNICVSTSFAYNFTMKKKLIYTVTHLAHIISVCLQDGIGQPHIL